MVTDVLAPVMGLVAGVAVCVSRGAGMGDGEMVCVNKPPQRIPPGALAFPSSTPQMPLDRSPPPLCPSPLPRHPASSGGAPGGWRLPGLPTHLSVNKVG